MVSGGSNLKKHEKGRDKKRKRNRKGKIASLRQIKKRNKQLRKKLKDKDDSLSFIV